MKKAYETSKIEYVMYEEDVITLSGGADEDTPVIGGDVNSELPFVPKN